MEPTSSSSSSWSDRDDLQAASPETSDSQDSAPEPTPLAKQTLSVSLEALTLASRSLPESVDRSLSTPSAQRTVSAKERLMTGPQRTIWLRNMPAPGGTDDLIESSFDDSILTLEESLALDSDDVDAPDLDASLIAVEQLFVSLSDSGESASASSSSESASDS